MNTYIDDGLSPFATRRGRNNRRAYRDLDMDDYSPSRRSRRSRSYSRAYYDDHGTQPVSSNSEMYSNNTSSAPSSRGRSYSSPRNDYDDYTPERKATSGLDCSDAQPTRRTPSVPVRNRATAPTRLDFSGARTPTNTSRGYRQNSDDLAKYLDYLERYDKGDLDNHDMGRIQRAYANNPFWQTFTPSRDLIQKYGSGNRSTRWPMFRKEGNRWVPEVWRNE